MKGDSYEKEKKLRENDQTEVQKAIGEMAAPKVLLQEETGKKANTAWNIPVQRKSEIVNPSSLKPLMAKGSSSRRRSVVHDQTSITWGYNPKGFQKPEGKRPGYKPISTSSRCVHVEKGKKTITNGTKHLKSTSGPDM